MIAAVCQGRPLIGAAMGTPCWSGLRVDHTRYDGMTYLSGICTGSTSVGQRGKLAGVGNAVSSQRL
jgi:hypothetical protein